MDRPKEWLLVAATTLVGLAIFFHGQLSCGFAHLFGDHYDGLIEAAILQHWTNVLHGAQHWNITGYFYPYADTLGYNDSYLVYGLFYSVFRGLGADLLVASELVHMTVKAIGCVGMFLLLRTICRYRLTTSLLGALLFTIASGSLAQANHGQLLTLAFVPFGALLLCRMATADKRGVIIWGASFALYFALWISTAYYMAWFFGFFTTLMVMAMPGDAWRFARSNVRSLAVVGAVFVAALVPFLATYLPKAKETGMHRWSGAVHWTLSPLHLIDSRSAVWTPLFDWIHGAVTPATEVDSEFAVGFPLVFLGLAIAGMITALRGKSSLQKWMAVVVLLTWLAALNYGPPDTFSPWKAIFKYFPGGKGMRVIARYQLFLTFPLVIFAMRCFDRLKWQAAIAVVLIVEQWNALPPTSLDRAAELADFAGVPPLPAQCDSFYIVTARPRPYPSEGDGLLYPHNVDAMLIAALQAKPTILGYSTFNPKDWNFADSAAADYRERVETYIRNHALTNVCYLDRVNGADWVTQTQ